jgi:Phage tail tube protein, GTA-gp10
MSAQFTTQVSAFFGDAKRNFKLTVAMIHELERTTNTGIGGLCKRLFNSDFKLLEVMEVIRCGLIGAGENPETAKAIVDNYCNTQPFGEIYPLAISILEGLMFGVDPLTQKDSA